MYPAQLNYLVISLHQLAESLVDLLPLLVLAENPGVLLVVRWGLAAALVLHRLEPGQLLRQPLLQLPVLRVQRLEAVAALHRQGW